MKACRQITILLSAFAARELSEIEVRRVEAHLAACPTCRAELARELRLRELMQELPLVRCPDRVVARIEAVVESERHPGGVRASLRPHYLGAALLAAAMVLLALWLPLRPEKPEAPAAVLATTADKPSSPADLDQARQEIARALALTAAVIDRTEQRLRNDVLRILQPAIQAAGGADADPASPGGRG